MNWGSRSGFPYRIGGSAGARHAAQWEVASASSSRSTRRATPPTSTPPIRWTRRGATGPICPTGPSTGSRITAAGSTAQSAGDDPLFHAIIERRSGRAVGVASYMRIDPAAGVIEVGGINYAPPLQRTPAATEAMYLMMRRVFDELGIAATNGNATRSTRPRAPRRSAWVSNTKACSVKPLSTRRAIATPAGSRSSTANGRRARRHSKAGSTRRISMRRGASSRNLASCIEPPRG